MYTSVKLERFKSFIDSEIPLKKLTVLTGLNSSGKSSVMQALRMLNNYVENKNPVIKEHGYIYELKNINKREPSFVITLNREEDTSKLIINFQDKNYNVTIDGSFDNFKCRYLSADRLGPLSNLPVYVGNELDNVGIKGEYVIDFLDLYGENKIEDVLKHPNSDGNTLNYNVESWLTEITPQVRFDRKVDRLHSVSYAEFNKFRSSNVGFGLSYSLPLLVSVLGMHTIHMPMMLIENPEAHLHPRGQTEIGKLLALSANTETQLVVETHSDHIIDGIRIAVIEKRIEPKDCVILFFSMNKNMESEIETIYINENGKLSKWPDGFFDQNIINKSIIAGRE